MNFAEQEGEARRMLRDGCSVALIRGRTGLTRREVTDLRRGLTPGDRQHLSEVLKARREMARHGEGLRPKSEDRRRFKEVR